ncbi:MAG: (2Fe-2S)-binding protein [Chlorobiaceae bacterium]|nr:(2Fe-2S)-binding protein [Chlorobiaceae bacterium]
MIIYINDRPCEAQVGNLLLSVAQHNKSHIGYICGGNGICQSCFVYVREGAEFLSQPGEEEKAFISDKLFQEGGRLACRTTIIREGSIRVVTRAETLRRIVLGLNVPGFITYAQTIGYNVVNQLPSGASMLLTRFQGGRLSPVDSIGRIANAVGPASLLVANNIVETVSFLQGPVGLVGSAAKGAVDMAGAAAGGIMNFVGGPIKGVLDMAGSVAGGLLSFAGAPFRVVLDAASGVLCTVSGGKVHLPGSTCPTHDAPVVPLERVTITMRP